jgi:histidinol-phosphate aminotransferase
VADSQTNFVYADFDEGAPKITTGLLERGLIIRPVIPEGWLRITAGAPPENERFIAALDEIT